MSYLRLNQNRLSHQLGSSNSNNHHHKISSLRQQQHSSSSSLLSSSSISSSSQQQRRSSLGGGGQIQIQRLQQQRQQNVPPQQQQQQQQHRVQGVISMEEVMADLRILEVQQQESERTLQQARVTKQRRLQYQSALEEKIDKCTYHNGQLCAEIQRSQELLSEGHRQVNDARKSSIKAGNDLREYDIKSNKALDIKASIIAHQITQDTWIRTLRNKVVQIDEVLHNAELEYHAAKQELDEAVQMEGALRTEIQTVTISQQRHVEQTKKLSIDIESYERKLGTLSTLQVYLKEKIESAEQETIELDHRRVEIITYIDSYQSEQGTVYEKYTVEQDDLQQLIQNKQDEIHAIWHLLVEWQKSEGHDPSPLPSQSDVIPIIDFDRLHHSLQIQLDANVAERKAKEEIDGSVQELGKQLTELQLEHDMNSVKIAELKASNIKVAKIEEDRRIANELFLVHYEKVRNEVDEKESRVRALQLDQQVEMNVLNMELDGITNETNDLKQTLSLYKKTNLELNHEIMTVQQTREELKESNAAILLNWQSELTKVRSSIAKLQKEDTTNNNNNNNHTTGMVDEQKRHRHMDEAQQRIDTILKEYPELQQLSFNYRPDLSDHEQAIIDLKKFVQSCNKRERNAEAKMAALEKEELESSKMRPKAVTKKHTASFTSGGKRAQESVQQEDKLIQESTSKPRALLTTFLRASQQTDDNEDGDVGNDDDDEKRNSKPIKAKVSRNTNLPDDSTFHTEKKVRWEHDSIKSGKTGKPKLTETASSAMSKPKELLMRRSFGSSDKPKKTNDPKLSSMQQAFGLSDKPKTKVSRAKSVTDIQDEKENTISLPVVARSSNSKSMSATQLSSVPKKRSSSRQLSGISSQERSSSKGRRRKRFQSVGGAASVGSKSGVHDYYDDDYNFDLSAK